MRKDELIHEIGKEILKSEDLENTEWNALSLVIELGDGVYSESGYLYCVEEVRPFTVETDDPLAMRHLAKELAEIIKDEAGQDVVQVLVQLRGSDLKIKMEFEYDDRSKWSITPNNLEEMKEALRPVF